MGEKKPWFELHSYVGIRTLLHSASLQAGLHQAGKTTALLTLLGLPIHRAVPTVGGFDCAVIVRAGPHEFSAGFECEEVKFGRLPLQVWDLQGEPARGLPRDHYYQGMAAIVFFVDSAEQGRFGDSAAALQELLSSPRLPTTAHLLVLANKQDQAGACSVEEVQQALGLDSVSDRAWHIAGCNATDSGSVAEALEWLNTQTLK